MQSLAHQRVRQPEHQRDVGAGPDRMPDRRDLRRQVVAQRADQVEFDAALAARPRGGPRDVLARTAAADIVVLQRHAAEGEDQPAVRDQLVPADIVARDHACGPMTCGRITLAAPEL